MRRWIHTYGWLLLAVVMLGVLFISSSMTYRQQTSVPWLEHWLAAKPLQGSLSHIAFHYAGTLVSIKSLGYFKFVEFFMRKAAHVGAYSLVGCFGALGLKQFVQPTWLRGVLTILSSAGLAAFDEFHQLLTGDRSPLFQDVVLDTCAATLAVVLVIVGQWWQAKHHCKGATAVV